VNAATALALATALHAGFQVTVTALVYPALACRTAAEWPAAHARHTRAITPVVVVVYGAVAATGAALVVSGPDAAGWVSLAATAAALGVTAVGAGPLHGRMAQRDDGDVARLLALDRWRCAAAVVGLVAILLSPAVG
jgi:hypothetical protein